jgi:DNA-directed RNA polymerase subunit RPC12/RpoP
MSMRCPRCGREFDVTRFQFAREIACPCGEKITLASGHEVRDKKAGRKPGGGGVRKKGGSGKQARAWDDLEREIFGAVNARERSRDYEQAEEIRARADRISSLILHSDLPRIDVEIEIKKFRTHVLEIFPEKEELLNSVYLNRFRRLWNQFRNADDPLFGGAR